MTAPDPTFGVTVRNVQTLLPNASLDDDTIPARLRPGAALGITTASVTLWIGWVAGDVGAAITGWERINDPTHVGVLTRSAKATIINGAAAYWERARTSQRTGGPSTYYDDLWARYQLALKALALQVAEWLDDGGGGVAPDPGAVGSGPVGVFPYPVFGDGVPW